MGIFSNHFDKKMEILDLCPSKNMRGLQKKPSKKEKGTTFSTNTFFLQVYKRLFRI